MSEINDYFDEARKNINNFSHWYPVLEKALSLSETKLRLPKSLVFQLPDEIVKAGFMDQPEKDRKIVYNYIKTTIMPMLSNIDGCNLFMKNGTFSNKFEGHYSNTIKSADLLADAFIAINYAALCLDAGGFTEMIIRERCPYDASKTPCIYQGLPFRPEFRVFYDFKEKRVLYSVNYWNWDYCYDAICKNMTDKIVYESTYPYIDSFYESNKENVIQQIENLLKNTKEQDLEHRYWSIDVMYDDIDAFWVIDMAQAECSAYWNLKK